MLSYVPLFGEESDVAEQILDWADWLDEKVENRARRLKYWLEARLHLPLLFQFFLLSLLSAFVLPSPEMDQSELLTGWRFNVLSAAMFNTVVNVGMVLLGVVILAWLKHVLAESSNEASWLRFSFRRVAWAVVIAILLEMLVAALAIKHLGRGDATNIIDPIGHWAFGYYFMMSGPPGGQRRRRRRSREKSLLQLLRERLGQIVPKPA